MKLTKPHAAVLQQVAEMVKHGLLVLATDAAEVAQEAAAAGHHLGEGNFLWSSTNIINSIQVLITAPKNKQQFSTIHSKSIT